MKKQRKALGGDPINRIAVIIVARKQQNPLAIRGYNIASPSPSCCYTAVIIPNYVACLVSVDPRRHQKLRDGPGCCRAEHACYLIQWRLVSSATVIVVRAAIVHDSWPIRCKDYCPWHTSVPRSTRIQPDLAFNLAHVPSSSNCRREMWEGNVTKYPSIFCSTKFLKQKNNRRRSRRKFKNYQRLGIIWITNTLDYINFPFLFI